MHLFKENKNSKICQFLEMNSTQFSTLVCVCVSTSFNRLNKWLVVFKMLSLMVREARKVGDRSIKELMF